MIGGENYIVREASAEVACAYRNKLLSSAKLTSSGKTASIHNMADVEPYLVSLTLYGPDGKLTPLTKIKAWPYRTQKKLYDTVMEISELREEKKDETERTEDEGGDQPSPDPQEGS